MYIILEQIWLKIALQVVAKFQEDLANAHVIEWWVTLCLSCSPLWVSLVLVRRFLWFAN